MNLARRAFRTLALLAAAGYGGEAPDLLRRLDDLEKENRELRKELARVAEEKKELAGQLEKLSRELRGLQATVDKWEIEHRQMERTLAQTQKDLAARVAEMVQQELQGRRTRFTAPAPPPGPFEDRPYLGFDGQDIEPDVARKLGLKAQGGVLITDVRDGSPAAIAGLQKNDVLVRFDGAEIKTFQDLKKALEDKKPNQVVSLSIQRGDEKLELKLTLGTRRVRVAE
ncbi:MAG: PDZ domain-containing protein [Planctomycetes bacterium]|nr:PDZ domain-containing protein [Planctomycetota bacterium]